MEKETKLTAEQGKKENEIVELTDEDMSTITAGDEASGTVSKTQLDGISLGEFTSISRGYLNATSSN